MYSYGALAWKASVIVTPLLFSQANSQFRVWLFRFGSVQNCQLTRTAHSVVFSGLEYRPDPTRPRFCDVRLPAATAVCIVKCCSLNRLQGTLEVPCLCVQNICVLVTAYKRFLAAGPISRSWCYYVQLILFKGLIFCPQATRFEHVVVQENECSVCF